MFRKRKDIKNLHIAQPDDFLPNRRTCPQLSFCQFLEGLKSSSIGPFLVGSNDAS